MDKKAKLEQLNALMSMCSNCALRCGASRVVPGDGSPKAKIMFIGEAPGKKEDEQGIPFVGAAGKFLNEMLASINLKREDIYIANVVKCRPQKIATRFQKKLRLAGLGLKNKLKLLIRKSSSHWADIHWEGFIKAPKFPKLMAKSFRKLFPSLAKELFLPSIILQPHSITAACARPSWMISEKFPRF